MPAGDPTAGQVVGAPGAGFDQLQQPRSQMRREGGRAELIVHDPHLGPLGELEHGHGEVPSLGRIQPRGAHDEVPWIGVAYRILPFELAPAVDGAGAGLVALVVGTPGLPVEDVVGGEVQDRDPALLRGDRQDPGAAGVSREGRLRVALGAVHIRVGRGVEEEVGTRLVESLLHLAPVADVELGLARGDHLVGAEAGPHHSAELPFGSGDQDPHRTAPSKRGSSCSIAARVGARRSFSESTGSSIGHRTATTGSSQAKPISPPGS